MIPGQDWIKSPFHLILRMRLLGRLRRRFAFVKSPPGSSCQSLLCPSPVAVEFDLEAGGIAEAMLLAEIDYPRPLFL